MTWQHAPQIVQWDITNYCNLKCLHCRASDMLDTKGKDLSYDEVIGILNDIYALSPNTALAMAGGEPLFRKDIKEILTYIKNNLKGMSVELLTNATLINKNNVGWLTELVNGFNISLEGASAEINDPIRGKGAFNKTVEAIKLLVAKGANLAVRMTFFHQDEDEPEKLMRFIKGIGVKTFNFRYLVPVGRANNQMIDAQQYKRLCERIWALGKELDMRIGFSDPFPELLVNEKRAEEIDTDADLMCGKSVTGCSIAFTLLYMNPQAIVQFCPYFPVFVEDAKKVNLSKIWYENETFNIFRSHRSVLKGNCGNCEYKFACGGCRGAAYAMGDCLGEEPRCWKSNPVNK